jgi:hypothetical protein
MSETEPGPAKIRTLVFLEDDRGILRKFPQTRYSRLFMEDEKESLPEHAGKWLRFAQVTVGMRVNQPPVILQCHYVRHKVAKNGRFDPEGLREHLHLGASQTEATLGRFLEDPPLPDLAAHRRKEDLVRRLTWEPTAVQDQRVREGALGAVALAWKRTLERGRSSELRRRLRRGRREALPAEAPPPPHFPAQPRKGKPPSRDVVWRVWYVPPIGDPKKVSKERFSALASDTPGPWPEILPGAWATFAVCQFSRIPATPPSPRILYLKVKLGPEGVLSRASREHLSGFILSLDLFVIYGEARVPPSLQWKPSVEEERLVNSVLAERITSLR